MKSYKVIKEFKPFVLDDTLTYSAYNGCYSHQSKKSLYIQAYYPKEMVEQNPEYFEEINEDLKKVVIGLDGAAIWSLVKTHELEYDIPQQNVKVIIRVNK